jgi:radical SAM superfamily enzyme YgiQ (UPF0313 family)
LQDLLNIPEPDMIFITCIMTYWYPGLFETIREIRNIYPEVPIVLGGAYATLCHEHASAHSHADIIADGPGESQIFHIIEKFTGINAPIEFDPENLDTYPYPAFDLQNQIGYVPLLTTRGCPFSCHYCASRILQPKLMRRSPEAVVAEIRYWRESFSVRDFAFYDDALLVESDHHADRMFEGVIASGLYVRFHTPNAVHIRGITQKNARLMFDAGMKTLRLGLETSDFEHREMDSKVREEEFVKAVSYLMEAGFEKDQVGAYLLVGLPGQSIESIESSIHTVKKCGITPVLTYYTPIPKTKMWDAAVAASRYDLAADPIFTNNAIQPCQFEEFDWGELTRLKKLIEEN